MNDRSLVIAIVFGAGQNVVVKYSGGLSGHFIQKEDRSELN
jgi:hypothetical protein